jgi:hypothetical protein
MRLDEIRAIAMERGVKIRNMKKEGLIRALLMTELESSDKEEGDNLPDDKSRRLRYEEYQL